MGPMREDCCRSNGITAAGCPCLPYSWSPWDAVFDKRPWAYQICDEILYYSCACQTVLEIKASRPFMERDVGTTIPCPKCHVTYTIEGVELDGGFG